VIVSVLIAEYCGVDERCKRASPDGMEQRSEPRRDQRLVVTIKGRDNTGQFFMQEAVASSLSTSGALLSGICREIRPGDLVWVEYAGTKSRFRVVWLRDSAIHHLIQAAIHVMKPRVVHGRSPNHRAGGIVQSKCEQLLCPVSSAPNSFKTRPDGTPVRVSCLLQHAGYCNISYNASVFSAYIH
jgi:hypothetical protein